MLYINLWKSLRVNGRVYVSCAGEHLGFRIKSRLGTSLIYIYGTVRAYKHLPNCTGIQRFTKLYGHTNIFWTVKAYKHLRNCTGMQTFTELYWHTNIYGTVRAYKRLRNCTGIQTHYGIVWSYKHLPSCTGMQTLTELYRHKTFTELHRNGIQTLWHLRNCTSILTIWHDTFRVHISLEIDLTVCPDCWVNHQSIKSR